MAATTDPTKMATPVRLSGKRLGSWRYLGDSNCCRHHAPKIHGTLHAAKNPGKPIHRGAPPTNRAISVMTSNAMRNEIAGIGRREIRVRNDDPIVKGTHAARNHIGCVASRAPSWTIPKLPVTSRSTNAARNHTDTTTAPRPTRARTRPSADWMVVVVFAHPDATKKSGIGDSIVSHSHRGYNSMMLTPRSEPFESLSITDMERWPTTTSKSEKPRAMSMAPRRD